MPRSEHRFRSSPADLEGPARSAGVRDERVLDALCRIPRAGFGPAEYVESAYRDRPFPIGHDQVTTQPSLSARMLDGLALAGTEHVLEVGTGLGFQTALLARLSADVVSSEWWLDLSGQARRNLDRQGIRDVELFVGDGRCPSVLRMPPLWCGRRFLMFLPPWSNSFGSAAVWCGRSAGVETNRSCSSNARRMWLVRRQVLILARFVRLHGRHGFPAP